MQKYIDIQHDVTICKNYQVYVDKFKKKLEEYEKKNHYLVHEISFVADKGHHHWVVLMFYSKHIQAQKIGLIPARYRTIDSHKNNNTFNSLTHNAFCS